MGKKATNTLLDNMLDQLINNADTMTLNDSEPSDYSDATTESGNGGSKLGSVSVSTSDFSKADGDTSGRKVTIGGVTGGSITVSGTASHIALVDDDNSDLLHVTTISDQSVSSGNDFDVDAYDEEIEDPT